MSVLLHPDDHRTLICSRTDADVDNIIADTRESEFCKDPSLEKNRCYIITGESKEVAIKYSVSSGCWHVIAQHPDPSKDLANDPVILVESTEGNDAETVGNTSLPGGDQENGGAPADSQPLGLFVGVDPALGPDMSITASTETIEPGTITLENLKKINDQFNP